MAPRVCYIKGVTIIAAPVRAAGHPVSRVVVAVGLSEQVRDMGVDTLARELATTANELAQKLGGR